MSRRAAARQPLKTPTRFDLDGAPELLGRHLREGPYARGAGVVDEDVERPRPWTVRSTRAST